MKRKDGGQRLNFKSNVAPRLFQQIFIRVSEKQDWLFRVVDEFTCQVRLVKENQRDAVLARNIFGGDDCELVPGNVALEGNLLEATARNGTANGRAVKHLWKAQIVNVARAPGNFVAPLFSRHRPSDNWHRLFLFNT